VTGGPTAPTSDLVATRLALVRERIERAGGDDRTRVVAVTKGFGPPAVRAAVAAGLSDVGESYAAELFATRAAVDAEGLEPAPRWHFLGRVQRNKVAKLAGAVDLWQAVDRVAAARAIANRAPGAAVLVQVNVSGVAGRYGCPFEEAEGLVLAAGAFGLRPQGLMAVGLPGPPGSVGNGYRRLAAMARELGLPECSMGMTGDLEEAVSAGSTMVRIGQGLFGPRPGADELRR